MNRFFELTFSNQNTARAVYVERRSDLSAALDQSNLPVLRPVLVLIGGANGLSPETSESLRSLFKDVIYPVIQQTNCLIVDGGTDAGVMRLIGQTRAESQVKLPLIGVVVQTKAILPEKVVAVNAEVSIEVTVDEDEDAAELEPHHTHFILVPGSKWGDEAAWIAQTATLLANGAPSVTVLVNGGSIALNQDVPHSIQQQRPVLVVAGSGRSADRLANVLIHPFHDPELQALANSRLLTAIELKNADLFKDVLQHRLGDFAVNDFENK